MAASIVRSLLTRVSIRSSHVSLHRRFIADDVMKLGRLNHIAIAVPNLADAVAVYKNVFQATVGEPQPLPEHGVTAVFVELANTQLELLQPLGDKGPIQNFLKKHPKGGMHHVCIEVDDILAAMKSLKSKNIKLLSSEPETGAHGKPVVFVHPKDCSGVLVELEQV